VQIDEEDEDLWGTNPFQLRILASPDSGEQDGVFLKRAQGHALEDWDKLKVLNELWEQGSTHKPVLYYVRLSDLPGAGDLKGQQQLSKDFSELLGESGIVVRTSVAAGGEKVTNLYRTECLTPDEATRWCIETAQKVAKECKLTERAFVTHRFVAARSSAWVRADPSNPIVEIHSLWGLPDALQYCPHDTWEVHVPTQVATDYADYKPEMLVATDNGGWRHVRVKNEVARSNSIGSTEAKEIASRSLAIADRMGKVCHIMWFVGCVDRSGDTFNMPWYWTGAHETEGNTDRSSYTIVQVTDDASLAEFKKLPKRGRQAIALRPSDLRLMRDNAFIDRVGQAAKAAEVPIILSGSTLAHAYYQLRLIGCAVVTPSRKLRSRIRRTANLGKLVRDKIPTRIAARMEFEVTKQVPPALIKGFLISKLVEEALEVREARGPDHQREELADLFEVVRALAKANGFEMAEIEAAANGKREKVGGFEHGLVLLQTGITSGERNPHVDPERLFGHVLADQTAYDTVELPFSFFGFMEIDQPRSILFEHFGFRVDFVLRPDRIELRVVRSSEQLALALDEEITSGPINQDVAD
jgi:predicted house-cleaning noncanonical NTP pyrophosphatase (MazG superfamily)